MIYSFDVEQAEKYGVEEAILLQNLTHWISKNKANGKHDHDGRTWTYNSVKAFAELFPFWSEKQVKRIIASLISQGVILTGNYNKINYDRTLWYALSDESILPNGQIEKPEKSNRKSQMVPPIPDIKPYSKPNNKSDGVQELISSVGSPELQKSITEWVEERRRSKKAISPTALGKVISRLNKWYPGDIKSQIECVENAIIGGWQGIFPLKGKAPTKSGVTTSEFMSLSPEKQAEVRKANAL